MPSVHPGVTGQPGAIGQPGTTGQPGAIGQPGTTGWPLVGRKSQLARIEVAYAAAAGGVVLVGEAGVGRTRLAREAWRRLAANGGPTVWITATRSAAAVPLGALAPLLAPDDPSVERDTMGRLLARFPTCERRQAVLAVDDAHLLDTASAEWVARLAGSGRAFVLATVRAGEPVPEPLDSLWTGGPMFRIDLATLPETEIRGLLEISLAGPMDPISEREVQLTCAGNPLLLRELLLAGQETGTLRQVGGVWRWQDQGYVTSRLTDVVGARLGTLPTELHRLCELLACGEPLAMSMLEALAGRDCVAAARARSLITVESIGQRVLARLAHPIYAGVLRAGMPRTREREICRLLARALAGTPMRRRDDALLAARWRDRAGLASPPELLVSAATQAIDRLDPALAERTARLAVAAGAGRPADVVLAEALAQQGRYSEAGQVLPALPPIVDDEIRVRALVTRQRIAYFDGTTTDLAEPDDPAARAAYSWLLVARGRNRQALRLAGAALPACRQRPAAASWAAAGVLAAAGLLGDQRRVAEVLTPAITLANRHPDSVPWGPFQIATAGSLALLATGALPEAQRLADRSYRRAIESAGRLGPGAAPIAGTCAAIRGIVAKTAGRTAVASAALNEAAALLAGWPAFRLRRAYLAELAATHALIGELPAARERLAEADQPEEVPLPLLDAWVERARAWVTAAEGDLTRAGGLALRAAELARATEQPAIEALALFDAGRFGETNRAASRLASLADQLRLPALAALARAAAALRATNGAGELDQAAATLAEHGYLLYAAEVATAAHARHAAAGRRTLAHRSLARASGLARQCGPAQTPLLRAGRLHLVLTSRELQVASLAAAGHSGGKIAAQLGLSPRTVNNYLGRVYQKLGVTGRAQLAVVLSPVEEALGGEPVGEGG